MMKINLDRIPSEVRLVKRIFTEHNFQLFLVGGCVRDLLLKKSPKDWDLATDATPSQVMEVLKDFHIIPVGEAFGVVRVIVDGSEFEVATFRKDVGVGRRPSSVEFASMEADVHRRDFTINAMFLDIADGQVHDLVDGLADLEWRKLRTVGRPTERFSEDPLRKLRAVRFSTRLEFDMDFKLFDAIRTNPALTGVSPERIHDEFMKCMAGAKSQFELLKLLTATNLLPEIFPNLIVEDHCSMFSNKHPLMMLAWWLRKNDISTLQTELNKLCFTNEEIAHIKFAVELFQGRVNPFRMKRMQLAHNISNEFVADAAAFETNLDCLKFVRWNLSVKGEDLMSQGFTGRAIGDEIERLENINFDNF